ncbi:MAG TPA: PDZ domain-containing protein [Polyangiales bacterium]|nr:PDZ domain-containing protein [Polyangiales bacterium]
MESDSLGDEVFQGLHILSLFPGSVAERAGLRRGDCVLIANGHKVATMLDFVNARSVYNDRLELTLRRGNHIIETVLMFDRPDAPIPDPNVASA